jgi:hypothetical protein
MKVVRALHGLVESLAKRFRMDFEHVLSKSEVKKCSIFSNHQHFNGYTHMHGTRVACPLPAFGRSIHPWYKVKQNIQQTVLTLNCRYFRNNKHW